jgi:hypothetical protein
VITRAAVNSTGPEMLALFVQIEARYPLAETITRVLDNATDTRAAVLREWLARPGCRGRVVSLPPDAPNLNLIARRWWVFKQKPLCNTHSPSFADFRSAIRGLFHHLGQWQGQLASLPTNRCHLIGHKPTQIPAA